MSRLRILGRAAMGVIAALVFCASIARAAPLLLRNPSLAQDRIAFLYAGDIWIVPRQGGDAWRLTSIATVNGGPYFSPDGSQIAYSTREHGITDLYVIGSQGGASHRLTWEPSVGQVCGWSSDGREVLFTSNRASKSVYPRLFRIHADGVGPAELLNLPSVYGGSLSSDGTTLAYTPVRQWQPSWKHYRGGQTSQVWLVNMKTLDLERVPRENSNDSSPVWLGSTVYFLSDRNGAVSLFAYDTKSKQVDQVLDNHGFDLKTVNAGPGGLVYEQFGSLHLYEPNSRQDHTVSVSIHGELSAIEPHIANVPETAVENIAVSPTGARILAEARGDIFTLPADKGDIRNLTQTPGVAERDPSWSPDGKSIAYFSDASGEYQLYIRDQDGSSLPQVIDLGPDPSFYYTPHWSPDSKRIAFLDKHLRIWYVDVANGRPVKIDTGLHGGYAEPMQLSWSPDSQWIAYTRDLESRLNAVFLYSIAAHTATQITDGMSNAANPVFDPNGKYLYFTASTNNGPSDAGLDLSTLDRSTNSGVYVLVLARATESPISPESDDEAKIKDDGAQKLDTQSEKPNQSSDKKRALAKAKTNLIDLADIGDRILSLPIPTRNYIDLAVGKSGVLFLAEGSPVGRSAEDPGSPIRTLWRFTTQKRQTEEILSGLSGFKVSFDGEKLFYQRQDSWFLAQTSELKPGSPNSNPGQTVNNHGMVAMLDLRSAWRQMYHETWRLQRDFLYDPHTHGLSIPKIEAKYAPFLENLASRDEFAYLCDEMLGEIQVGHSFVRPPRLVSNAPKPGMLGADFTIDHNRYRFAKVYRGQNWTPSLTAPLAVPGINIVAGDYLLGVNGRELHASDNVDSFFDGTAGKQTVLRIGKNADGSGGREVTVVPTASDYGLRNLDWINANRRKVDELSGGRIAYVYMPNTGGAGYTNFNRYFYAQLDKQGLILDERFNQGGYLADYIVSVLGQKHLANAIERDGEPSHEPQGAIFGPKAMLINQSAGSGGDAMPWYFRKAALGTLVGTRTWGGLVAVRGYPNLIDGGAVTAPRYAIYGLNGEWEVEGHGIVPDVVVEELPKDVAAGHDAQLERAVAIVMQQLQEHPVPASSVPPYPDYHKGTDIGR